MLLNLLLAWVSTALAAVLAFKIVVRLAAKRGHLKELNTKMRSNHKQLGIALMITGLLHGLLSTTAVFSANLGTLCFLLSTLFGIHYYLRKKLKSAKGWVHYHRLLTVIFMFVIVLHVSDVGGVQIDDAVGSYFAQDENTIDEENLYSEQPVRASAKPTATAYPTETALPDANVEPEEMPNQLTTQTEPYPTESVNTQIKESGVVLKEGTYTGTATGYRPGLTVSVQVKDNKVTDIVVTAHNEVNKRHYGRPVAQIPQAIVEGQSLDVDVVSGATRTSNGIIKAVRNALAKAIVSGTFPGM